MIRAEEIKKGNLLKHKEDIIKVIGIDQYDCAWFFLPHVTGSAFCDKIEIFEPIELTEEWLIKWQFSKRKVIGSETPYNKYSIRNDYEIYCFIDISGNCLFYGECIQGEDFFIRKCNTVHDFQNIYAVLNTHEELTIK